MKVIETAREHDSALARIDELLDLAPEAGSTEANELEVLAVLVEAYERETVPLGLPDPIDAIKFRMEQQGLRQVDLVLYVGSRSKVSEVLAGKRPLTLSMIRALHEGLEIPADVLLQKDDPEVLEDSGVDWKRFPVHEMVKRGWVTPTRKGFDPERILRSFFRSLGGVEVCTALYKRTDHVRSRRTVDRFALAAWTGRLLSLALERPVTGRYMPGVVTHDFMREVARKSRLDGGPRLAQEFLGKHGIALIVEPHLPKTHLDGAAVLAQPLDAPVIGLTIRHDRIDNFWFCLMHELAHISLHLGADIPAFYDEDIESQVANDVREAEADMLAGEVLIPDNEWETDPVSGFPSHEAVYGLARKLGIHSAVVAGRVRKTLHDYGLLSDMIGQGEVRRVFSEVSWS